jgi:hypothetical protein
MNFRGDIGYCLGVRITPIRSDGIKGSAVMAYADDVVVKGYYICNFPYCIY